MENCTMGGVCEEGLFSRIFTQQARSLRNYLVYKFGDSEKANDLTQDAFAKLWENCADVPEEKAKSYLYTVANNAALNKIAHKKVVLAYAQNTTASAVTTESPEFVYEEEEFRTRLHHAIGNLSDAQRTAFLMNRIDGKKYHEIAELLEISVKAVEKRISGALVSLRREIGRI
ncbi:RNA polymerase sigma factor [Flavobacterium selenitireducens]|uniref:RNA polymerase sigma factor n=1 Tax=Flavobacterium selenitireducens TaxID=2722704 RepID=UPI00168B1F8C|nr:sigma-70 family RNA polymerase sigma factor [Flavobacterium selenitireducens]MBD3582441.1 sigma-70 family RNA polymerase sigma factor [Flavobacterium selenitireducens]